jgi:hypothetical protein
MRQSHVWEIQPGQNRRISNGRALAHQGKARHGPACDASIGILGPLLLGTRNILRNVSVSGMSVPGVACAGCGSRLGCGTSSFETSRSSAASMLFSSEVAGGRAQLPAEKSIESLVNPVSEVKLASARAEYSQSGGFGIHL